MFADSLDYPGVAVSEARNSSAAACVQEAFAISVDYVNAIAARGFGRVLQQIPVDGVAHQYALTFDSCLSASSAIFTASPPFLATSRVIRDSTTARAPVNEW